MEALSKFYKLRVRMRGLKCEGCNLGNDYYSNGYYCFRSGLFFHKECTESSMQIFNLYHPQHPLHIKVLKENEDSYGKCKLCRGNLAKMYYYCSICDFAIDLICAKKEVTTTIESPKTHMHPLSLVPNEVMFTCNLCERSDDRFPYTCNLCDLKFHKDCAESTPEINYSCHPKHVLKRLTRIPNHSNEKCWWCKNKVRNIFYYCFICNFSVDINCAKDPPSFTLVNSKAHEHSLTLMPQRNFVCNVCGTDDDPNPYVCLPCNFMIHRNCIDIPYIIKIGRHDHRIYFKYFVDAGDWKCKMCHYEINWTCGVYSCSKCPSFFIHVRCATKFGIWDGTELSDIQENTVEVKSYEVIGEGVIKHFSHGNHTLKLNEKSNAYSEYIWCKACTYPIFSSPFYSCIECDDFILHKTCADLPRKKVHPFYKMSTTLITPIKDTVSICTACQNIYLGFTYASNDFYVYLDVRCGSITEPFIHESHTLHPLYVNYSKEDRFCNACGDKATMVLSCEECGYFLDIKCSVLPKIAKHKNDKDHFLFLCYGDETIEQYWCDICEEEVNPKYWFYSCDQCGFTFHIRCTLGDFMWFKRNVGPSSIYRIQNNHVTRPICSCCYSRCYFPFVMEIRGKPVCSLKCFQKTFFRDPIRLS